MLYDFKGWATKNDVLCADGRTIRKGAFSECDGKTVPLVYNHDHNNPFAVLGHALLKEMDDGIFAYCSFNDTEQGQNAKLWVQHGDVSSLSIYANQIKEQFKDVVHGVIREVSLVLAGANPGAKIESVVEHSEDDGVGALIYTVADDESDIEIYHSDDRSKNDKEDKPVATNSNGNDNGNDNSETIKDVFDTLTEKQKNVVYAIVGAAIEAHDNQNDDDDEEGDDTNDMKHNAFDTESRPRTTVLAHSDMKNIIDNAKNSGTGSLKEAFKQYAGEGATLQHSIDTTGMDVATGDNDYGINDTEMLFPEPRNINNPPEFISRDMGWVDVVMSSVSRSPFSRIKSMFADITEDEARAKGYIKGNQKKTEVFTTLKRSTTPQTIYKFQKLDRDDVIDITDFSVVEWMKGEMRVMLREEQARAILIGDGRDSDEDDKIDETHVRPIATDVPLFNVKVEVKAARDDTEADIAEKTIDTIIKSRKNYKGSGNPIFFTTEDALADMLLLKDGVGRYIYKSEQELATVLRVSRIVTVEPMENYTIEVNHADKPLIGIIVNLKDYRVGADKGGETSFFDDFDLNFNKYEYLLETRMSGALVKPFSALTVYLNQASN